MNAISIIFIFLSTLQPALGQEAVTGEFVVKLSAGTSHAATFRSLSTTQGEVRALDASGNTYLVRRPTIERPSFGFSSLQMEVPRGATVEPNYIYTIDSLPNDPQLSLQSNLVGKLTEDQLDCNDEPLEAVKSIGMENVYGRTNKRSSVLVAVVDTGVDLNHVDLNSSLFVNQAEFQGQEGIDDDNNGYVDDLSGFDFVANQGSGQDDHGHGTHISGVIAASTNNGIGMAGINNNVKILPVKFIGSNGAGTLADAIEALNYAAQMGAQVVNASWGGGGRSEILKATIEDLSEQGILFVAAAGNSRNDNDLNPMYPASYRLDNVISVAGTKPDGSLAESSNYGLATVHIAAPGENIFSTVVDGYACYSGTSMATAHVTGALALAKEQFPQVSTRELKERLLLSVEPIESLKETTISGGFLRVDRLLELSE